MGTITQSIAWWCFVPNLMTPEEFVRAAAEAGYGAIDLAPQEYWPLVVEHGLAVAAIGGHDSIINGLNRVANHARIEKEIRANLVLAETWGISNLICFTGSREGQDDSEGAEITAAGLAQLAPYAEATGVNLVLELLNSKVDHPDYQADHTAFGLQVCKQVASPRVKLLYDIYHMQIMEGDLIRNLREAKDYIGHYHTAGNPGRNDLDGLQEINYPAVWRAISDTGYSGYLAHEFIPKANPVEAIRSTHAICAPYV